MSNFPICEQCGNAEASVTGNLCGYCQATYPQLIDHFLCHECGDFKTADGFTPEALTKPRDRRQCNSCLEFWDQAYEQHKRGEVPDYEAMDSIPLDDDLTTTVKAGRSVAHHGRRV